MKHLATCVLVTALAPSFGCSTIGDPGATPDGLPHGGTGQFRLLDSEEVGVFGLPGRALAVANTALENGQPVGDLLFYVSARGVEPAPMLPDPPLPEGDIFWDAYMPRAIHRGTARMEGTGAYDAGDAILSATEAWEGTEVFDPWVVVNPDGTARLYYAAEGGIGVATAPSPEGSFSRVGTAPILGPADARVGSPRRPSVVIGPDGAYWMYYDAGGEIRAARSDDGAAFIAVADLSITGDDTLVDPPELSRGSPGAIALTTTAGRVLIRLYFESIRTDGTRRIYIAGSDDGRTFFRHPLEVMEQTDARFPAPRLVDSRVTLLYSTLPFFGGPHQTRAIVVAVGPAGERFDPPMED